jgi:hypothetical protein
MAAIMFEFDVVEMFANSIMAAFSLEHTVFSSKFGHGVLSRLAREALQAANNSPGFFCSVSSHVSALPIEGGIRFY